MSIIRLIVEDLNRRRRHGGILLVVTVAVVWIVAVGFMLDSYRRLWRLTDEVGASHRYWHDLSEVGIKFREGSDRLTLEVTQYVLFEDSRYMRAYFHEADVTRSREHALEALKGVPGAEQLAEALDRGMDESVRLMETEFHAMRLTAAASGVDEAALPEKLRNWKLTDEERAMDADAKRKLAGRLIFGKEYNDVKERIWRAASEPLRDLLSRVHVRYDKFTGDIVMCRQLNMTYTLICIVMLLLSFYGAMRVGLLRYKSKERQMLAAVMRERDAAVAAERAKDYFFASVSHDIRSPLNSIIGFSELLRRGDATWSEREMYLEGIETSGKQLLELINDVLDLGKIGAGKIVLKPEPVDVLRLVSEVVNVFLPQAQHTGLTISSLHTSERHFPYLDRMRFRQVLMNLVGNAVKYTEKGGVNVKVDCDEKTKTLVIAVKDTGRGISPEDKEKLMQPYVQLSHADGRKGTGLGLAICRQLVELMGGRITIESELGAGSVFTVRLERVRFADGEDLARLRAAAASYAESMERQLDARDPAIAKLRLLVADDMPLNITVLKQMLKRYGITKVVAASNGRAALNELRGDGAAFDLVLTDMWMPEMGGEEFIRIVRADPELKDIPVYAVTADVEILKNYQELGFTGTLLKPVTFEALAKILSSVI